MSIVEVFCRVDDFWNEFAPEWEQIQLTDGKQRLREGELAPSEIMTILIHFHQSCYRTFKDYYLKYISTTLRSCFPKLISYSRFVQVMPQFIVPLLAYQHRLQGRCSGTSFIDSTTLAVCKNPRIAQHHVFLDLAARGKTSVGWFYGFKLHLVINEQGDILAWALTAGNVDDRVPVAGLVKGLFGKLFGDKGYRSQKLFEQLYGQGIQMITKLKKNMKNKLMPLVDKLLLRKRAIIESVNDQLKNISQIEHTRHRSPLNFLVNLLCGLIAYSLQPKKPSLLREGLPALQG